MKNDFVSSDIYSFFTDETVTENALKAIVSCMFSGIILAKENGHFSIWNIPAKKIIGFKGDNVPIELWAEHYGCYYAKGGEIMKTSDLPLVKAMQGEHVFNEKMFISNANQPGVWINCNAGPVTDKERVIGGVLVFQDITYSYLYDEANEKLRSMMSSIDKVDKKYSHIGKKR